MASRVSVPTGGRRVTAIIIVAGCALFTVAVKFGRDSGVALVPFDLAGVWPNFAVAIVTPLLIFGTSREVKFSDYLGVTVAIGVGLIGYEVAQIWMPRRVFDWHDITATVVGTVLGIVLGRMIFFRKKTAEVAPMDPSREN